uniref:Uncharacterized protein n=1 Tax=Lygus hesperus TaxID=30085 RepID=A0A0A9XP21_LYGHE
MEQQLTRAIVEELYSSANEKVLEIRGDSPTSHFALLRLTCRNKEEFVEWFHNHQSMTGVTFRVKNVRPFKGITIVYKAEFRCQHNTYPDSHKSRNYKPSKQHTGCESTMKVTIKSSVEGRRIPR